MLVTCTTQVHEAASKNVFSSVKIDSWYLNMRRGEVREELSRGVGEEAEVHSHGSVVKGEGGYGAESWYWQEGRSGQRRCCL
jgi:hypothetical protein